MTARVAAWCNNEEGMADNPRGGDNPSASFKICGAGSGIIFKFLGFAGLHQMQVTPKLDPTLLSNLWSDSNAGEEEKMSLILICQWRKRLFLNAILENSLLTDSAGMLGTKTKTEGSWVLDHTPLVSNLGLTDAFGRRLEWISWSRWLMDADGQLTVE